MLNDRLDFATLERYVKDAFIGKVDKVPLNAGTKLFKFTDHPLFGPGGVTPWWCFVSATRLPSGIVAEGFRRAEEYSRRLGVSHSEFQKRRLAVGEGLGKTPNRMRNLLLAEVIGNVWGFAGKTGGQREFSNPDLDNVYLIGGSVQVWIPNLTKSHIRQVPTASLDLISA
jgi:hypothetical protein